MTRTVRLLKVAGWSLSGGLILLTAGFAVAYFVDPTAYGGFFGDRDPDGRWRNHALLHIGPAAIALVVGAVQLALARNRTAFWLHPLLGLLYVAAVGASAVGAALILPRTLGGPLNIAGFVLLELFWVACTALGCLRGLSGHRGEHRAWMLRSYALTLAGVSLRLQMFVLTGLAGWSFEDAYALTAWSSWAPNLVVCEWLILRKASAGTPPPAPHGPTTGTGPPA